MNNLPTLLQSAKEVGRVAATINGNEEKAMKQLGNILIETQMRMYWPERFTFWGKIKYHLGILKPPVSLQ